MFVQIIGGDAYQGRHGEKKRELGGRTTRQTEQQTTDDGGAGARSAGDQRRALRESNLERIHHAHVINRLAVAAMVAPFRPQDDEAADDESYRDRYRLKQHRLDVVAKQETQHHGGQERDHDVQCKAVGSGVAAEAADHTHEARAVFPDHGEDGAGLDHHLKDFGLVVVEVQQIGGQDQMAGGGNRQELSQAFDNAEDHGLPVNNLHAELSASRLGDVQAQSSAPATPPAHIARHSSATARSAHPCQPYPDAWRPPGCRRRPPQSGH